MEINAKYHAGDKFIAEIEGVVGARCDRSGKQTDVWYRLKNGDIMESDLDRLEKVDPDQIEKDAIERDERFYTAGRIDGQNEAWLLARRVVCNDKECLMPNEMDKIFGNTNIVYILANNTGKTAVDRLRQYETAKKTENEIKVGDICRYVGEGNTFVITRIHYKGCRGFFDGVYADGFPIVDGTLALIEKVNSCADGLAAVMRTVKAFQREQKG